MPDLKQPWSERQVAYMIIILELQNCNNSFLLSLYFVHTVCVIRLGGLLHFWQLFKACGTIILPKLPTYLGNFCKGVKIFYFFSEIIFGNMLNLLWSILLLLGKLLML